MSRLGTTVPGLRWTVPAVAALAALVAGIGIHSASEERRRAEVVQTATRYVDALVAGDGAAAAAELCPGVSGLTLAEAAIGYAYADAEVNGESAAMSFRLGPFHRDGRWQTYRQLELWMGKTQHGWCIAVTPTLRAS